MLYPLLIPKYLNVVIGSTPHGAVACLIILHLVLERDTLAFVQRTRAYQHLVFFNLIYLNVSEALNVDALSQSWNKRIFAGGFIRLSTDAPLNAFYLMALSSYESLSTAALLPCESITAQIKATRAAYVNTFFSEEEQAFRLSTYEDRCDIYPELVQALSVLAGVCEDGLHCDILQRLANKEFSPSATLSHRIYCYQALMTKPNMKDYILHDVDTKWFEMIERGATSFWETEKGAEDFKLAGSLCHGWSAAPIWVYWNCI